MDKKYYLNPKNKNNNLTMPRLVGIPVTTRCNLNCKHCLRNKDKTIANYTWDMSIVEAQILADKFKGKCKMLNLSAGYGEPFLNCNISHITKIFHQANLSTIVYTNGTVINKEVLKDFFSDIFIVSVDLFHHGRVDQLLSWLNTFLSLAAELNFIFTNKFIVSCVIDSNAENYNLVQKLCELQHIYSNIYLEFHWRMRYDDEISKTNDIGYLKLKNKYRSSHIEFPTFLHYVNNHCKDLWGSLYFDHNGNFRDCCVFQDAYENLNIFNMSLEDIWGSNDLLRLREEWRKNGGFKKCKQCPIGYGNVKEWR